MSARATLVEDDDPRIVYSPASSWAAAPIATGSGTTHSPSSEDVTATLNFTGTGFEVVLFAQQPYHPDFILVACHLDDRFYSSFPDYPIALDFTNPYEHYYPDGIPSTVPANITYCSDQNLTFGNHTLILESNGGDQVQDFALDYIRIFGEEIATSTTSSSTHTTSTSTTSTTTTTTLGAQSDAAPRASISLAPVVGGAVGGGIALALIVLAVLYWLRRWRRRKAAAQAHYAQVWGTQWQGNNQGSMSQAEIGIGPGKQITMAPASSRSSRPAEPALSSPPVSSQQERASRTSGSAVKPVTPSEETAPTPAISHAEDSGWRSRSDVVVLPPPYTED